MGGRCEDVHTEGDGGRRRGQTRRDPSTHLHTNPASERTEPPVTPRVTDEHNLDARKNGMVTYNVAVLGRRLIASLSQLKVSPCCILDSL